MAEKNDDLVFPVGGTAYEQDAWLDARQAEVRLRAKDEAKTNFPSLLADIKRFAPHMTAVQMRQLGQALGGTTTAQTEPDSASKATKKTTKAASRVSGGTRVPKYKLPDGTTWGGQGRTHKDFAVWAEQNPGVPYPINPQWAKQNPDSGEDTRPAKKRASKKATKKGTAKRVTKKSASKKATKEGTATKKATKKGSKGAAKKGASKKTARKATKKRASKNGANDVATE